VTQLEEDRQRALHRFYAIAFLHNVTGIKGAPQPAPSRSTLSPAPTPCRHGRTLGSAAKRAAARQAGRKVVQQQRVSRLYMERRVCRPARVQLPMRARTLMLFAAGDTSSDEIVGHMSVLPPSRMNKL
jgi:hypothetical protein